MHAAIAIRYSAYHGVMQDGVLFYGIDTVWNLRNGLLWAQPFLEVSSGSRILSSF